ncbi:hypothetical protein FOL47_009863 [Perkinsus chesapeaki]|uniref:Uncharacterized protein n=1 Tax=Perkinsus chesapeaki TaxID=330153 RepID=A0A7J6L627_PERCH|nr:hypothetical protein FOL47_009863 [Perkinsus chesapeaki]
MSQSGVTTLVPILEDSLRPFGLNVMRHTISFTLMLLAMVVGTKSSDILDEQGAGLGMLTDASALSPVRKSQTVRIIRRQTPILTAVVVSVCSGAPRAKNARRTWSAGSTGLGTACLRLTSSLK